MLANPWSNAADLRGCLVSAKNKQMLFQYADLQRYTLRVDGENLEIFLGR